MAHRPVGIILTAGFGTRLRPLSLLRPKPLMEVAGRPIIYFLIRMLEKAGIQDIFLNLHHQAEKIRHFIERSHFKARIHLVYEKEILGTAGGIKNILKTFALVNRQVVVMHGDIICDTDLNALIDAHDFCTLLCAENHSVPGYIGSVSINRHDEIVELGRFFSRQTDAHARGFFTGVHVLSADAAQLILASTKQSLVGEIYPQWLKEGRIIKGIIKPLFYDDLGTQARIFQNNMAILKGASFEHVDIFEGLTPVPHAKGIFCGHEASIAKSAKLTPPLIVAAYARIGAHAQIGPNVVIGEASLVGEHARISNSVVLFETRIEKDEILDCMMALRSARVLEK